MVLVAGRTIEQAWRRLGQKNRTSHIWLNYKKKPLYSRLITKNKRLSTLNCYSTRRWPFLSEFRRCTVNALYKCWGGDLRELCQESESPVIAIAGVTSIVYFAKELETIDKHKREISSWVLAREEQWQIFNVWNLESKSIHKWFFGNVGLWRNRKGGDFDYFLTRQKG